MERVATARTSHVTFAVLVSTVALTAVLAGRESATLVATSGTLTVLARQVRAQRAQERAWLWVLVGVAVLWADAVTSFVLVIVLGHPDSSGPVAAAALPVAFAALLAGAMMLISPPGRRNPGALIDATLVAITFSIALWAGVLHPHLRAIGAGATPTWGAVLVMLLLGGIAGSLLRTWIARRSRHGALGYVLVSVTAAFLGSAAKVLSWSEHNLRTEWWVALFWAVAYAALAAAALHPTANALAAPRVDERLTASRIAGLGTALLVAPVVVGIQDALGRPVDGILLGASALIVVPLVLVRVSIVARLYHEAEARLAHLAEHDELTGLANRRAVTARLRETLTRVAEERSPGVVVAFADLDDFKAVNDDLGHPVGDRLLAAVSTRLRAHLRASDVVARFGGDEFLIVCEGEAERVESRIQDVVDEALAEPFVIDGAPLLCRASVGTVLVRPGEAASLDEVLSAADAAMYRHKGRPAKITPAPGG